MNIVGINGAFKKARESLRALAPGSYTLKELLDSARRQGKAVARHRDTLLRDVLISGSEESTIKGIDYERTWPGLPVAKCPEDETLSKSAEHMDEAKRAIWGRLGVLEKALKVLSTRCAAIEDSTPQTGPPSCGRNLSPNFIGAMVKLMREHGVEQVARVVEVDITFGCHGDPEFDGPECQLLWHPEDDHYSCRGLGTEKVPSTFGPAPGNCPLREGPLLIRAK